MSKDNVLRSTMGLMARDNDNEAVIALRQATKMLKARGLDWSALADMAIEAANDNASSSARTAGQAQSPYGSRPQPQPQPQPQPKPQPQPQPQPPRIRVSGDHIPQVVEGEVLITLRERTRSGGTRVVFYVTWGNKTYGPIVAYRKLVTSALERAYLRKQPVKAWMLTKGEGVAATGGTPFMPQAGDVRTHY